MVPTNLVMVTATSTISESKMHDELHEDGWLHKAHFLRERLILFSSILLAVWKMRLEGSQLLFKVT